MTTAQDWIDEVKRHLLGGANENLNRLNGTISAGAATLIYEFVQGGIIAGATIELELELMYVWSVDTATKTATVQRGMNGTTAAGHSDDVIITVQPRFPQFGILKTLNQELYDLSSPSVGLYRIANVDLTVAQGVAGYDFSAAGYISTHELHYEQTTAAKQWKRIDDWRVIENADLTDFPSGRAMLIADSYALIGSTVKVTYKRSFSQMSTVADDVLSVTGMPAEMHDIPPLGALVRLAVTRGVKRNFDEAQGEPRRATEVNETGMIQNVAAIMSVRGRRIAAEVSRLNSLYPRRLLG